MYLVHKISRLGQALILSLLAIFHAAAESDTYVIGIEQLDYYPHFDFSRNNDKGYAWRVLQQFAKKHELKFEYISLPPKRLQLELAKGTIDFAYPDNPRWHDQHETKRNKTYSQGLALGIYGTMVKPNALGKDINQFKRLAYPIGFTPIKWLALIDEYGINAIETYDASGSIRAVVRGRADGADIEYNVAHHLTSTSPNNYQLALDPALPFSAVHFSLSTIFYPELIKKLDDFLIEEQQYVNKLKAHYQLKQSIVPADYQQD